MYQKVGGFKNQNYLLMGTSREDKVQNQQNCNGFRGPLVMQQLLFQGFTTHALVLRGRERVDPTHSHASEKTSFLEELRKPLLGSQCSGVSLISISQPKLCGQENSDSHS